MDLMTLFEIVTTSVPVPNEKGQFTRIEQLPKYVTWNPSVELFVTFDEKPAVHNGLLDLKLGMV